MTDAAIEPHRHPRKLSDICIDVCGFALVVALMIGLTGLLVREIRREADADVAGRAAMAEKVKGARAEHGDIEANQREILRRLERIEAKMGGAGR